jgi:hypothetical protein
MENLLAWKKKSLVQIMNNLSGQFKLKKKKKQLTKMVSFWNKNVCFLTTFTKTEEILVHSEWMHTSATEFINSGTVCLFRYVDARLRLFTLSSMQRNSYMWIDKCYLAIAWQFPNRFEKVSNWCCFGWNHANPLQ